MLLWNDERHCYDADITRGTGGITLRDYYGRILRDGPAGQELRDQKLLQPIAVIPRAGRHTYPGNALESGP